MAGPPDRPRGLDERAARPGALGAPPDRAHAGSGGRDAPAPAVPPRAPHAAAAAPVPAVEDEESQTVFAVLSGATRKGRWEPPAELRVVAVMGGVNLDFCDADLLEGETVVDCLAIMGGVDIVVPADVHVRTTGLGLLGGFAHLDRTAADPDAPALHIKGFACMGGVGVRLGRPKRRRD